MLLIFCFEFQAGNLYLFLHRFSIKLLDYYFLLITILLNKFINNLRRSCVFQVGNTGN